MARFTDGPASKFFSPLPIIGSTPFTDLPLFELSAEMAAALPHAPSGLCVCWGIPFDVQGAVIVKDNPVDIPLPPTRAPWLVFMHTADIIPFQSGPGGFTPATRGKVPLAQIAAEYVFCYEDGTEVHQPVSFRHQIGFFRTVGWGENSFQAVTHGKPYPDKALHEQKRVSEWGWGMTQTRVSADMHGETWQNFLWAWENPFPQKYLTGLRLKPGSGAVLVSAVSAGHVSVHPLRWEARRKAVVFLPPGEQFSPDLDDLGRLEQIQLDLGQVISAYPRLAYPDENWGAASIDTFPEALSNDILIEYSAHPQACFHLWNGSNVPVPQPGGAGLPAHLPWLEPVQPAFQRVILKVMEAGSRKPVAVRLHVHGEHGEYLPPVDRHRLINQAWFEDFGADHLLDSRYPCCYINGVAALMLPRSKVFVEITKGYEIAPVRKVFEIGPDTQEIVIEVERLLSWRSRGWVTADTHVHFLSPVTALLEGAAEGVNVVNLLASQWGELVTNAGDFDGRTTWGESNGGPEGDHEYLVRVGTENRQSVLGHISLLGYDGAIIAPMTTGGPNESALGDPVENLLTEWARQCRQQGGLAVLPHFPNPRCEQAAVILSGQADAVEMTFIHERSFGIDPYSLSDWYRYLNCGYRVPAVGGTDKMSAATAVGAIRTYAHIPTSEPFTYPNWMKAVRSGRTFVTDGPLLDFSVEGAPMGGQLQLPSSGGRLDVTWEVATLTCPVTKVELVRNGEILYSHAVPPEGASGSWQVSIEKSGWLALLVRGQIPGQPEKIAAHSSPVMVWVEGSQLLAAADAMTILDQIEGALAYLDTIGVRQSDQAYKRMRLDLVASHRLLHNRLHQQGYYHEHNLLNDHHQA